MTNKLLLSSFAILSSAYAFGITTPNMVELSNLSQIVSNGYFHGNAILVDINNDGNLEIVGKGRDLNNNWQTDVFCISGDGYSFKDKTPLPDPDGCSWERTVVPIDFNCDGNMDIILASSWGSKLLINNGDGTFDGNTAIINGFGLDGEISIDNDDAEKWYTGVMAVADFNGDGYPDILTFKGNPRESQGKPVIYVNDKGSGKFNESDVPGLKEHRNGTLAIGDFNRDGMIDIAVSGWQDEFGNNCIKLYKNNGNLSFSEVASESLANGKAGTEKGRIMFLDIDNDGYLDLFVTGESGVNDWKRVAFLFKNEGGEKFTKMDVELPGVNKSGADWCDLNGDGLIDFIYAGQIDNADGDKGMTIIAYNNGDGTFKIDETALSSHRSGAAVEIGDFNNNLVPDVILMGYNDNGPHFQIYNSMQTRGINTAPSAPEGLKAVSDGNATLFSWDAASDKETPATALRYNIYVKLNDNRIITLVPSDFKTGKLKTANVDASIFGNKYRLEISIDDIAEWGVQSIDGGKAASRFTTGALSSVDGINDGKNESLVFDGENIIAGSDSLIEIYTISGTCILKAEAKTGDKIMIDCPAGIYIAKAGTKVLKFMRK